MDTRVRQVDREGFLDEFAFEDKVPRFLVGGDVRCGRKLLELVEEEERFRVVLGALGLSEDLADLGDAAEGDASVAAISALEEAG